MPELRRIEAADVPADVREAAATMSGAGGARNAPAGTAAPAAGMSGGATIPEIHAKGVDLMFPGTPQKKSVTDNQKLSQIVEDVNLRINAWDSAWKADAARNKKTGGLDRIIGKIVGAFFDQPSSDPQSAELVKNYRQKFGQAAGLKNERSGVIFTAAQLRAALIALQQARTATRSYQAVKDIQAHLPQETDTDEMAAEKSAYWHQQIEETQGEIGERGVRNYGKGKFTGKSPFPTPPFKVKSIDATGRYVKGTDTDNRRWYVDPETNKWVKMD